MTTVQRLLRRLYTWAASFEGMRGLLDVIRRRPLVRRLARRNLDVLLSRGSTWVNVDGSLRLLAEDDGTVVFGPWKGDVITELLYWIPFLRAAQVNFALDPARFVAVSRGGVAHWYAEVCEHYVELLDHVDEAALPDVTADTVRAVPELKGATVFPPGPVLGLVASYRKGAVGSRPLLKRTRHTRLPVPDDPVTAELPDDYLAVALAPTAGLPESPDTAARVERLVRSLADSSPVVWVDATGPGEWAADVWTPLRDVPAGRRLRAQHAVIARSRGFIAAYSGLVLLGMLSGVPVIALRTAGGHIQNADLDMALLVGSESGGSLNVLELDDLDSLQDVLGRDQRSPRAGTPS